MRALQAVCTARHSFMMPDDDAPGSPPKMIGRPVFDPEPGNHDPGKWQSFFEGLRVAAERGEQPAETDGDSDETGSHGGPEDDADPYVGFDSIDFSQTLAVMRELVFFDDVFLNMQAINVAVIDPMITQAELSLLREWFEIERTPLESAMQVSALSQMWVFALYELLRTWRERIKYLRTQQKNGMLKQYAERVRAKADKDHHLAAQFRAIHAEQVLKDPGVLAHAEVQRAAVDPVWKAVEAVRINLAKHGAPGGGPNIPVAPGYGRINMLCGAMDFQITIDTNETYFVVNRRDIADALRATKLPERGTAT